MCVPGCVFIVDQYLEYMCAKGVQPRCPECPLSASQGTLPCRRSCACYTMYAQRSLRVSCAAICIVHSCGNDSNNGKQKSCDTPRVKHRCSQFSWHVLVVDERSRQRLFALHPPCLLSCTPQQLTSSCLRISRLAHQGAAQCGSGKVIPNSSAESFLCWLICWKASAWPIQ